MGIWTEIARIKARLTQVEMELDWDREWEELPEPEDVEEEWVWDTATTRIRRPVDEAAGN